MPGENVSFAQGRANQAVAQGADLQGAQRRHWNNRKYGASTLRFPQAKEFLRKL